MPFIFEEATKSQAKARIAISGPAGAGKTYTALKLASLMGKRVAVIDTEHGAASKYADEFKFARLNLDNFHPTNGYVPAIQAAAAQGFDVVVIDSASHEWNGKGGCLELVDKAAARFKGNSYAGWGDVTPLHNEFIEAIHASPLHVIATFRSKMDYVQTQQNGRTEIRKVGMAPVTRDGAEYEFDIVGEMDLEHRVVISKTRCRALTDAVIDRPGQALADTILAWLSDGVPMTVPPTIPKEPESLAGKAEFNALWAASQAAGVDADGLARIANEMLGTSFNEPSAMRGVMTVSQAKQILNHLKGLTQAAG